MAHLEHTHTQATDNVSEKSAQMQWHVRVTSPGRGVRVGGGELTTRIDSSDSPAPILDKETVRFSRACSGSVW